MRREVMRWYRDFQANAPEEFYIFLGLQTVPSAIPFPREHWGKKMCVLLVAHNGPQRTAKRRSTRSAQRCRSRSSIGRARCPTRRCRACSTRSIPKGLQWYWKGDFVKTLPDEAIDAHIEHAQRAEPASLHASLSDRWRGASQGQGRHGMELPRRHLVDGDRRRSIPIRARRRR